MKNSFRIAAAGVLTALSVIFLALGSVVWIFSYTMPLICGLIMIILTESLDRKTALMVYLAVSIISFILLNDHECALLYALFFGYYPIIREKLHSIKRKAVSWALRLAIFNAGVAAAELICIYVFGIPFDGFLGKWGAFLLLACGNLIFIIYEKLFSAMLIIYHKKYKKRIDKYFK